uniref:carbohydrate-binding protein n=1 Tax=Aquimarina pacifica TaxID=1296415 RepID=UPI0013767FDA
MKKNQIHKRYYVFEVISQLFDKTGLFYLFIGLMVNSVNAQLVHPGGWHTQEDLTLIRTKVAAEEEPWTTGWNAAKNNGPNADFTTNPSTLITDNGAMHTAGMAAWVLTMKWVASGDKSYSDAAIDIIDTWVDVVRDFDVYGPTLTVSTGAGAMAQAAEILEHGFNGEAGWSQTDADAAKSWFKEIIYDAWTNTGTHRSTNWGTSALGGNMSMAIFMNNEYEYNYQVEAYKFGYQDTDDGCAALTDYIFDASGQAQETGRDQAHVQGGIAHLTEAALCMWNQGNDIVYAENNRLLAGVEYHARYNLGYNDLPFTSDVYNPCNVWIVSVSTDAISEEYRGEFSPVYYMSAKLFSKAGLDHPNTKEVLTHPGYSPEINNFAHPGLGMFTFVSTSSDGGGTITCDGFDAFSVIQAEDYCDEYKTGISSSGNVGYIENGDWIMFQDVDFGRGAIGFDANVSSETSGGNIELRTGSASGDLIGTFEVSTTGSWTNWETESYTIENPVSGVEDLYLVFTGNSGFLMDVNWIRFIEGDISSSTFTPDPNKTYYIDVPHHNLRLSSDGESAIPETTSTSTTGADVEWKFVDKDNGSWHIQRAAGGTLPRLRTDNTISDGTAADMQGTAWSGTYTYFDFEEGAIADTYFITLPDGPAQHVRLQIDNSGNVQMVENTRNGTWESFKITEASNDTSCDWVTIASEGEVMNFSGSKTIRYGANEVYVIKVVAGNTTCGNAVFGDPLPGVGKACQECIGSTVASIKIEAEDYDGMY